MFEVIKHGQYLITIRRTISSIEVVHICKLVGESTIKDVKYAVCSDVDGDEFEQVMKELSEKYGIDVYDKRIKYMCYSDIRVACPR
ncbi:MAG: hypothetical protein L7G96_07070 [Vulcanisaeta sp.]|jgi:hypothetical protein|nr:hypothetical protein [Vulcanisaeta sp.]